MELLLVHAVKNDTSWFRNDWISSRWL